MNGESRSPEQLLADLGRELRPLGWRVRRRALAEASDHLLSAIEDEVAAGSSTIEAERRAAGRFGEPALIAASLIAAQPRHAVWLRRTGWAAAAGAAGAALVRLGWNAGAEGPGVPIHRAFLIVVALTLVALLGSVGRQRRRWHISDSWAARLLRFGVVGGLCALPLVLLDLSSFSGARFERASFAGAAERAQWHAERVHDAVASSVVVYVVIAVYATGCLWLTSGRSHASPRTLRAGGACGLAMGVAVYALTPFGSLVPVAGWLRLFGYLAVLLALFGAPVLAGRLAARGGSSSGEPVEHSLARIAQGLRAGLCAGAVGALVIALLAIPTMVHFPDRVALKEPHPGPSALTYDRQMSVGDGASKYLFLLFLAPLVGAGLGAAAADASRSPLREPGEVRVQGRELPGG